MSIKEYGPGDHPSGFVGYRVTVFNGRRWREKYYSLRSPSSTMPTDFWTKLQLARARHFEALCRKNAAAADYLKFVRTAHRNATPESSLGVHALGLFIERNQKAVVCGFVVSHGRDGARRFPIRKDGAWFSAAYSEAVNHWADFYSVRNKDRHRLLSAPPAPRVFQSLRRYLNANGENLTPEEISVVFLEQRTELARQRAAKALSPGNGSPDAVEIAYWFEREVEKTA